MTPVARARVEIYRPLEAAGWHVCDYKAANIHAAKVGALREFLPQVRRSKAAYLPDSRRNDRSFPCGVRNRVDVP